jgi:hypothetical protein
LERERNRGDIVGNLTTASRESSATPDPEYRSRLNYKENIIWIFAGWDNKGNCIRNGVEDEKKTLDFVVIFGTILLNKSTIKYMYTTRKN